MKNAKIIRLLSCFSGTEIKEFRKFVCSPYHNNRTIVIKFYDVLKEYHPEFNSVTDEQIYTAVFPDRKFNKEELIKLNSYLFKLAIDFLAVSTFKESGFYYDKQLLESLSWHDAHSFFDAEFENAEKKLINGKLHNQFFLLTGMLEVLKIDNGISRNKQKDIALSVIKNAEYDIFHMLVKLAIRYTDMFLNKNAYNYDFNNTVAELFINSFNFESFISNLKKNQSQHYNFILYYYYQLKAFSEPDNEKYYQLLKKYTFNSTENLAEEEMETRYIRLLSYCAVQIRRGNLKFLKDCFQLHKAAYEKQQYKGIATEDFIYPVFFRNFVIYGLVAKKYDYIEKFIQQSGGKLNMEYRKDLVNVSSAMLLFERKCYNEVLELLNKVRFSYPGSQMDTKLIYIKTFYETGNEESLISLADAFRHYLKREKTIHDTLRVQSTGFLNYTTKLLKIKLNNKEAIYSLQKHICGDTKVDPIQKLWLMKKADELSA